MAANREPAPHRPVVAPLDDLVDDWVRAGLISTEQGAALRRHTGADALADLAERPARRRSLAIEALGYLGGMIVVVAALLLTSMFWDRMTDAVRLGILVVVAVGVLAAGAAVPSAGRGANSRLRTVLWLAATAASAGAIGLAVAEYTALDGARSTLVTAAGTFVIAAILWLVHRVLLQQVATFVALVVATSAAFATVDEQATPGFAIWVIGACWLALGQLRWLQPRGAVRVLGAVTALGGLLFSVDMDSGIVLGLVTATGLVVFAVLVTDLPLLIVGAIGMLAYVQIAMVTWLDNSLAAVVALLLIGLGLVAVALWVARRRPGRVRGGVGAG